jgi:hypothetical protein
MDALVPHPNAACTKKRELRKLLHNQREYPHALTSPAHPTGSVSYPSFAPIDGLRLDVARCDPMDRDLLYFSA